MVDSAEEVAGRGAPDATGEEIEDPISSMTPRYNLFFRGFAHRYFRHLDLDDDTVHRLRALEERGSVVYVMRYASRLDYFLMNTLFVRHGLGLSRFANGIRFFYYRPVIAAVRAWWRGRRLRGETESQDPRDFARERVRAATRVGEPAFLFLRTARLREWLRGREMASEQGREQRDLLSETVRSAYEDGRPVFLVPIALFWRKGPRSSRRFLNLAYGAPTRPSDVAKVSGFLLAYKQLSIKLGDPIDLAAFVEERREEGLAAIVRKVRRSLLLFLYREERVVEGPALWPRHRVQEHVLAEKRVQQAITARASDRRSSPEAARAEAERVFREIAAHMNSTLLAVLNFVFTAIFHRMFGSIEPIGIEKVAEYAKRDPVVLVPSHRSYFDFLILSWMFYGNYLVPPHIAARENMAFGPFGYVFRRAGAFFLRRSFDDPLYKEVFRAYVGYLVREGFTQEFFIEGGRSRTGKSLSPRLGMLSWNLEAFVQSHRRDLYVVPVGITYERLVEESSMVEELEGGEKSKESVLGVVRARKYLQQRFGSATVNFGEPISLARAVEGRRHLFEAGADEAAPERRRFIEELGNDIVERINWAMVANATSVAAAALLGEPHRGLFRSQLVERMQQIRELLRLQDVRMTPALAGDEGSFAEAIEFLLRADLIRSDEDPRGEVLYYEESRRRALDVYRNVLFHYLVAPSFLARRLLHGTTETGLREDLAFWLDLLYAEFYVPQAAVMGFQVDALLDYFERIGAVERHEGSLEATEKGRPYFTFLSEQTRSLLEAYFATFGALLSLPEEAVGIKALTKSVEGQFARAHLLGEVRRVEALNTVTVRNAIELLVRRGVLESSKTGKDERAYARGPAFDDLPGLRERLAGALAPL